MRTRIASALVALAGIAGSASCAPSLNTVTAQAPSVAQRNPASGIVMNRHTADRFPGAALLGEAEFDSAVVGRAFRYREVGSEIVVERPKEVFREGGQYQIHWLRAISYGTYSVEHGIVSIACADCPHSFLDLGRRRIFFRHQGRLLTAKADGKGSVVELIREP
jgi:hypothetical protein